MLDLNTLDLTAEADKGRTLHVKHPVTGLLLVDADGAPVTVTAMGAMDGTVYLDRSRERRDRLKAEDLKTRTSAQYDAEAVDDLVSLTLGWSGIAMDGKELPFTHANARMVYTRFRWLREQVEEFVGSRAVFFGESGSPSSAGTGATASGNAPAGASPTKGSKAA